MLRGGLLLQRSAAAAAKSQRQHFHSSFNPKLMWERLLSAPKGFGKFYPPGSSGGSAGKTAENAAKSASKPKGTGGGNNKQPDNNPEAWKTVLLVVAAAGAVTVLASGDVRHGRVVLRRPVELTATYGDSSAPGVPTTGIPTDSGGFAFQEPNAPGGYSSPESGFPSHEQGNDPHSTDPQGKFIRYPRLGSPSSNYAPYYFMIGSVESFERKLEDAQKSLSISPRDFIPVMYVDETDWAGELLRLTPTLALIGLYIFFMRGAGGAGGGRGGPADIFKIGRSTAKKVNKENVTTTFADVAGCDEAKREVMEFVEFLRDPKKFTDLGAKIPKGALLCGPPGTGKTLLAKATAGESNVPFFSISGSDFVEMFVGVGPSRVRDLFKEARANSPSIIFIDEIDAIGRQRGKGGMSGGNDERESTLNQLLVEMDGFDGNASIVVLAGTNRVDILDSALTRPGRFDRQIQVDKPDIAGRKAIFEVHLKGITLDGQAADFSSRLAALTPGFSGADIANICNEAAIVAARRDKKKVDIKDFESATDRIIGGLETKRVMSIEERRVVAYHEAGHAIAGWNLEHADPLLKVTIIPRGSGALGFAQYLPKEIFLRTREQILDMVCMALAGRAAEQVNFGKVTTGAADDLRRVTQIVYQMVQVYGMNDTIGQVSFPKEDGSWPQDKMYSNLTAEKMDAEVRKIVDEAYARTLKLMEEKREQVRLVAELLLEKETITNSDVAQLVGKRPYGTSKEYDAYVSFGWDVKKEEKEAGADDVADDTVPPTLSPAFFKEERS